MDIEIQISEFMSRYSSPLGSNEDRLIRIPATLREKLGLRTGPFLCLTSKDNGSIPLQISTAYKNDAENNDECGYVSRDTYGQLRIKKKYNNLIKPVDDILIGADPEFFLVDKETGGNISASHFFLHYGDVGSDCGLAELRPRPSFNEYELVSNMRDLMVKAHQHLSSRKLFKNRKIEMTAASMLNGAAAGFHIHFGLPNVLLNGTKESHAVLKKMVDILDYYIGIPSILPEGSEDFYRRSDKYSRYGKPGDYRSDHLTLEYRVPGGHLLRHPLLAAGILGISIVTMKDLLSRLKVYSDNYEKIYKLKEHKDLLDLYPKLPDKEEVYASITSNDTNKAILYTKAIIDDMRKMVGYADRTKSIIDYFDYVLSYIKHGKKFDRNIEYNWRLEDEEQSRKMAIL